MQPAEHPAEPGSSGDRIAGPLWVVFGVAVVVEALRTERLAAQGVPWFAAPGLVPGLIGIAVVAAGLGLSLRAWRRAAAAGPDPLHWPTLSVTLLLCLGFAGVALGRGLPFGVAAGLYLFAHVAALQWRQRGADGQRLRGLLVAAGVGTGGGLLVPLIFEQVFLVRLP